MAAKGAAFGIRHLLKKVDENFAWAQPRGRQRRRKGKPNGCGSYSFLPSRKEKADRKGENWMPPTPWAAA